ncbi:hypothetical protein F442_20669 [Phytophthora nicotianae P10297]|uniref:BZIP domain-containing protein n=2 Tax=Phytophthora nicotianae TaxID=4792 RepID=V9DZK6_PHYNI|nr:hypothetical protein F443_20870 [Phytophthora nicotianae P1569]ETP30303.1 hypothetical protein F442_20669 [Phytophthora nicotianae P10297]
MSLFIEDRDSEATLEEALAIIDSFDLEDAITSDNSDSPHLEVSEEDNARSHTATKKMKKRKRSNLSSSTRLQQRKKAELLYLRRHVQEMEEYIEQLRTQCLQDIPRMKSECVKDGRASWMELASLSYQARLQSEETNRGLKAIMATQAQVSESLRGIIQMQVSFQEDDAVYTEAL